MPIAFIGFEKKASLTQTYEVEEIGQNPLLLFSLMIGGMPSVLYEKITDIERSDNCSSFVVEILFLFW